MKFRKYRWSDGNCTFSWLLLLFWIGLVNPSVVRGGSILREVWENIQGTSVSDLTTSPDYPNNPTSTNFVTDFFEAPTDVLDNYGQRMHGYIIPPITGNYTFWISSDDAGELWLSTDDSPANKTKIAMVANWTPPREWTSEADQQSGPIPLLAGRAYYIAALEKEGGGGDNLAVRWLRPDGMDEGPIPATYLLPYGTSFTPPTITQQPTNITEVEGQLATFTVQVSNLDLITYRWQRNGTDYPGSNGSILQVGPVRLSDSGSRFQAYLSNSLGSTNTTSAVLTVIPDTTKPTLAAVQNQGHNQLVVTFSEPVEAVSSTVASNYALDKGVSISGVGSGPDNRTIVLTTSSLAFGASYTLTVSGVQDRAATPNTLLPGSQVLFTAVEYVPADVGQPSIAGGNLTVPGGFDVTGGGKTIGGASDQFQLSWQSRSGNFDVQVRVAELTLPDPFARGGLMLRESLDANARFGAVFAGSPPIGCYFESRMNVAGAAGTSAIPGGFPANYPYTWLRLQRQGSILNGYASLDAQVWTLLGSATFVNLPTTVYLGFAVSGDTDGSTATARFRDFGATQKSTVGPLTPTKEPMGPSSRATSMVFTEIMYHPAPRADGRNLEFVELANARSVPEDLTGWRVSGAIDYGFPDGFRLRAGEFVVLAAAPDDVKAVYGITNVLGPYGGSLPGGSGTLRLRNNADAIRLEVTYSDSPPWPAAADGAGHSLVLARPSYGEADPAAWAASEFIGGSPGGMDPTVPDPLKNVVINEFLAHTDPPQVDFLELYNHSNNPVDLSGCWLSDDPSTNKFRIPSGTTISARGFLSYDSNQLGFRLNAAGETIYFVSADQKRVFDSIRFEGQENGVSSGRFPDGDPTVRRLASPTPGTANASWRGEEVVINEIMYAPMSGDAGDQYVELYNRSASAVDLSGWEFTKGISFTFPANTTLLSRGYLVVANNAAQLERNYPNLTAANTVGDFGGKLSNNGDHLVLSRPHQLIGTNTLGALRTNLIFIVVSEVSYGIGGRWGQWANGGGSSLELTDPDADPLRAANWADSDESTKAPWTTFSVTNRLDNGDSSVTPNRLRIGMQGAGECLVDDVEVFRDGGTNLVANAGFENGATGWKFFGDHSTSAVESSGAATGSACLHVRGLDSVDSGVNGIRTPLLSGLSSGATGVIRAKVRWLRGWPEVLFRLQGNYLELPARMTVPVNLGTPGQANSRLMSNAGPAIYDVTHRPALPAAGESVKVTCRLSDPDGIGLARVQYRLDPSTTLQSVTLRDDGSSGDDVAGDGIYTGTIPGQGAGQLAAFRIVATDGADAAATSTFPVQAPSRECLIRWDDTIPVGTFAHDHLWSTTATEQARNASVGLDNTWRDATLVYGNFRVIYNVGFRDKGSPYHQGVGDIVVNAPDDDLLLGTTERNFASTGNGGPEQTDIRSQLSAWLAEKLEIPYLHAHYMRLYRNGALFRSVSEDLEVPNRQYAKRWFPDGGKGDFYKVGVWFEFNDDNLSFSANGATLQRFTTVGAVPKLARYRWNWLRRADGGTANDYTNIFDLVDAANDSSPNYTTRMSGLADMEEWMRIFAYHRITGNWDSWTYSVGQNMFALKQPGLPWKLIPWDIDFTFGLGDGATAPLGGGSFGGNSQDPVANKLYNAPAFRRMLWRACQDAVAGPLLAKNYAPEIDARRSVLLKNNVSDATDPKPINSYIEQRRNYIQQQLNANDAKQFAITSNGGSDFESSAPTATLTGTAPFVVAEIDVNGVPYPLTWLTQTSFQVTVPLPLVTNVLLFTGKDRLDQAIAGVTGKLTVKYNGAAPQAKDYVAINEIQYHPSAPNASFVELYNRSTSVPFDLSGFHLEGVNYIFPSGAIIPPAAYLLVVQDKAGFSKAYGATVPVFDTFSGTLANNGERLALIKAGPTTNQDEVISEVHYESQLPWPPSAAGLGPSLQLIDSAQDPTRAGNWAATETNDVNRATPGRANALQQNLAPFPPLWINEVQPENTGVLQDNAGQSDPWLELYNSGSTNVDLSVYFLTDSYASLTKWPFPPGAAIGPHQFLVVWADGESAQTRGTEMHTNFRLSATNGSIALVRLQGAVSTPAVIDYINYKDISAGRSWGSAVDGTGRNRQLFQHATPGAGNDPIWPALTVTINEVLAGNTHTLLDPATGHFDDWFELYNAAEKPVDLAGYMLSDSLNNANPFVVPGGTLLPPGGFLLVWADNQSSLPLSSPPLHVPFKLKKAGAELALFDPSGKLVDGFAYTTQVDDVSIGRYPDGADLPLITLDQPTPGTANLVEGGNHPPVFLPVPIQIVAEGSLLQFTVTATDPDPGQQVTYSFGPNAPASALISPQAGIVLWSPTEADGPGTFTVDVRATDNGTPARSSILHVAVVVTEVNSPPQLAAIPDQVATQGVALVLSLQATDSDLPANNLSFSLDAGAPEGAQIDPQTGVFTWTPSFAQAAGDYSLTARVTDNGIPALSSAVRFTVSVQVGPTPPVISPIPPVTIKELTAWQTTVHAVDFNTPPSPITYSLDIAPDGAQISPAAGVITWTPSEAQGPTNAVFVVRATRQASPILSATATFSVAVLEVNQAPSLRLIPDQLLTSGQQLVMTNTASDPDLPLNHLRYSLDAGAPLGMSLGADSGILAWTPAANQVPSTNRVTVRVSDDASPPLSDAKTFTIVVKRGSPWQFVTATGDATSSTLYLYLTSPGEVYLDDILLVAGSQAGFGQNTLTDGDFETPLASAWTVSPNLAQSTIQSATKRTGQGGLHLVASSGGTTRASAIYQDISPALTNGAAYTVSFWYLPGTNDTTLIVRLSGSGISSQTTVVALSNSPPILAAIPDHVMQLGETLTFNAAASDADQADVLVFSLDPPVPAGASINPQSGAFSWTPTAAQTPSTNRITVRVIDSGIPPKSDQRSFTVAIGAPGLGPVSVGLTSEGAPTFSWSALVGRTYRVEYKDNLDQGPWQSLVERTAVSQSLSVTDSSGASVAQRFYRVVLLP